jgi:hypothetical protein
VGLAWSYDPESYTGGSAAIGTSPMSDRSNMMDDPEKMGYPVPPCCWGLGIGLTTPRRIEPSFLEAFNDSELPSSGILDTRKDNVSETTSVSVLRRTGKDTYSDGSLRMS